LKNETLDGIAPPLNFIPGKPAFITCDPRKDPTVLGIANPETDLYLPLPPAGATWNRHTLHTHYFGFQIPEAEIAAFIYLRYLPAFALTQGGVTIFRGTENIRLLDAEYVDYETLMPWPQIEGNTITSINGLVFDFLEPGKRIAVRYDSGDGTASFDLLQTAITPLVTRGHVMPGEEEHHGGELQAGGTEQFMHCTGELTLRGETYAIDCRPIRDRSWNQVRAEHRGAVITPPIGWSPMCFGPDLAFNQVGYEHADTDPEWKRAGLFADVPDDRRAHHFAWVLVDGELHDVPTVRRNVLERHPMNGVALRQEIEAVDEQGREYRFHGRALAISEIFTNCNQASHDTLTRWESDDGRVTHCPYQEVWHEDFEHVIKGRRSLAGVGGA
jgi:hypothetical protein